MSEDLPKPKALDRWDVLAERIERLCGDIEQLIAEHRAFDSRVRALEVAAAVSDRTQIEERVKALELSNAETRIEERVKALELSNAETRGGVAAAKAFAALLGAVAGVVASLLMKLLGKG